MITTSIVYSEVIIILELIARISAIAKSLYSGGVVVIPLGDNHIMAIVINYIITMISLSYDIPV